MRGGPGVIVTGVLMTVDSHCSVSISSLSEGECLPRDPSTVPRATDDTTKYGSSQGSTDNTAGIIGGTFATVIVIVVAIVVAIIGIAALILKNRGAGERLVRFNPPPPSLSLSLTHTHTHTHTQFLFLFRHEKTLVGASVIPTSSNSAYEMVRKKTGRHSKPQPVQKVGPYEVPLPSLLPPPPDQPLPPLPPSSESEETEQVYETIPC